jgi:two-component system, OmpR family, phosphate regulon sensor histidine kinase PhoR
MFLSKKWILTIISVTGISFLVLLIIQFGWIRKSIVINRRHFDNKMIIASNSIREAFLRDKILQRNYLMDSRDTGVLFNGNIKLTAFENIIRQKVDSVLVAERMPSSAGITGQMDEFCYLMSVVPDAMRNEKIDHSPYKICLCSNNYPVRLDIGFDLLPNTVLLGDSSGLVLPSLVLILLLIALFAYIIYVVERQKRLADLKNDFINNLTHEFNTPLFSIGLTTNLLLRSDPVHQSDKLKTYVDLITTEKTRIQMQVDKILKLTAVESENSIMEKQSVDIHALIEQNVAGFSAAVTEKEGTILFNAGAPRHIVEGDTVHLFNVISNLIDNGIKYADKKPEIIITTSNTFHDIVVSIRDNGIGMKKSDLQLIFNKFYRIKQGDRHDVKGFGLGLPYVKKVVGLHKGSVEVNSEPGKGSVFIIYLPVRF